MTDAQRDAFEVFASKGPVNVPGAQRKANQALDVAMAALTLDERLALRVARSHALCGEGRSEFDDLIGIVRTRLARKEVW